MVALHRFWTAAVVDEAKERRILIDDAFVRARRERFVCRDVCVYRTQNASSDFVLTKMEKKFSTFYA